MKFDDLTLAQLVWVSHQFGEAARKLVRIKLRTASRFPLDNPLYRRVHEACHALHRVSEFTHARLNELRGPVPFKLKRSRYTIARDEHYAAMRAERDRQERGL